jgi:hypothetical protein
MEQERFVECSDHGPQPETFVCKHIVETLVDGHPRGFWWSAESSGSRPDAWCSECEHSLRDTGGQWTGDNEELAGVSLLCAKCYDLAKELNFAPSRR